MNDNFDWRTTMREAMDDIGESQPSTWLRLLLIKDHIEQLEAALAGKERAEKKEGK